MIEATHCLIAAADENSRRYAEELVSALQAFIGDSSAPPMHVVMVDELDAAQAQYGDGGVVILAMMYLHTAPDSAFFIKTVPPRIDCCVMLNVPMVFPFLDGLRRRAQALLGEEVPIIEMPADGADDSAIAEPLRQIAQILQLPPAEEEPPAAAEAAADDVPAAEEEAVVTEDDSAEEEAEDIPAGEVAADDEAPAPSAEPEPALVIAAPAAEGDDAMPLLDAPLLAELLGFPLLDIYNHLHESLSAQKLPPLELGDLSVERIEHYLKETAGAGDKEMQRYHQRFCAVCFMIMADHNSDDGGQVVADTYLAAYRSIHADDNEFMPLRELCRILAAQAISTVQPAQPAHARELLAQTAPQLLAQWASEHQLLYALFLRVQMMSAETTARKDEMIDQLLTQLPYLLAEEIKAIGAESFVKIAELRKSIGDIL